MIEFLHSPGNLTAKTIQADGTVAAVHAQLGQPEYDVLLAAMQQIDELREERDQFAMALDVENTSTSGLVRCYQQVIADLNNYTRASVHGGKEMPFYNEACVLLRRMAEIDRTGRTGRKVA
ncbi:hypothetical protein NFC81_09255 [Salinispirillum sp. LH 10-3-1]|uniref:Uncharacterized protein n=1 Tax=Salinispirillum sp. LH 10-3-1 TaxID=2952525 RepID=A0AB38YC55_9GAMM